MKWAYAARALPREPRDSGEYSLDFIVLTGHSMISAISSCEYPI
jgi:hypothetical protein